MTYLMMFAVTFGAHHAPMQTNPNTIHYFPSTGALAGPVGPTAGERLVLTVTEAAGVLGISRALAYELVARGELPSIRLGRRVVVPRARLAAMVAGVEPSGTSSTAR